jgi:hypothetical protein
MTYPSFPMLAGMEFPVKRSPVASSLRQKAISGRETFQPLWTAPLYKYEVSFALLREAAAFAEWQELQGFWNTVMFAPGGIFQFDDPNDNFASVQPFGTGDGSTTAFRLVRALGGFSEPVFNPTPGPAAPSVLLDYGNCTTSPSVTLDYGNCTAGPSGGVDDGYCSTMQVFVGGLLANYAVGTGGIVTIAPAPASGAPLVWSGPYAWLCRFDEDTLEFSNFMYLYWELKKCDFTTIRP